MITGCIESKLIDARYSHRHHRGSCYVIVYQLKWRTCIFSNIFFARKFLFLLFIRNLKYFTAHLLFVMYFFIFPGVYDVITSLHVGGEHGPCSLSTSSKKRKNSWVLYIAITRAITLHSSKHLVSLLSWLKYYRFHWIKVGMNHYWLIASILTDVLCKEINMK